MMRAITLFAVSWLIVRSVCAEGIIPDGSRMAGEDARMQRMLLSPLDATNMVNAAGWGMKSVSVSVDDHLQPKVGAAVLRFEGDAEFSGAKGDFAVVNVAPGEPDYLGTWIYLTPDANVAIQIVDAEGEYLSAVSEVDGPGWKWLEGGLAGTEYTPAFDQPDKNHKVDFPLRAVSIIWFTKNAGPSCLGVNGLASVADAAPSQPPFLVRSSGPAWREA